MFFGCVFRFLKCDLDIYRGRTRGFKFRESRLRESEKGDNEKRRSGSKRRDHSKKGRYYFKGREEEDN